MITSLDQNNLLYALLADSGCALRQAISGKVCKEDRMITPGALLVEDVVINALPITADQVQDGVVNVNIYAPDLLINGTYVANHARLNALTKLALIVLYRGAGPAYSFSCANQDLFAEPDAHEHYVGLRIEFTHYPT